MGVISAQNNISLAKQNQALANQTYQAGKIRERQGITSGNPQALEEGQELQTKGKEMELGTFEHLGNAMSNINNQPKCDEPENLYYENSQETQVTGYEQTSEFNVVVCGDTAGGSVNSTTSTPSQGGVDISV